MTNYKTIISPEDLAAYLQSTDERNFLVLDCSFDLVNLNLGLQAYKAGHIPGAHYVHLEEQLSGQKTGLNGRHPLPSQSEFLSILENLGVDEQTQIIVYDNASGMYAARLWWMCRWVGHDLVAVLDGGVAAWQAEGFSLVNSDSPGCIQTKLSIRNPKADLVSYEQVRDNLNSKEFLVVDARASDRYRGENETMDPVGGHIPGAVNHFFKSNLSASGRFRSSAELLADFQDIFGQKMPTKIINQCGSGVTACHNLLAMEIAGLTGAKLYGGSWSEWCVQPDAVVATNELT